MNRKLMEKARSMLNGADLSYEFWAEAVDIVCYPVNCSPSSALIDKSPYEAWDGKNPSLAHIRVFGFEAFMHVPKEKRAISIR